MSLDSNAYYVTLFMCDIVLIGIDWQLNAVVAKVINRRVICLHFNIVLSLVHIMETSYNSKIVKKRV